MLTITRLAGTGSAVTTTYTYTADFSQVASLKDPLNRTTTFAYDAVGNLKVSRTDALGNADSYAYDAGSRLARVTDRQGQVSGFAYDALHRRVQAGFGATPGSPTAYTSTIGYAFDAGNRLLSAADSQAGTITRSYDGLDRLTQESAPQGTVSCTCYANGLRQTMTVAGQAAVSYAYDAANRLTSIVQGRGHSAFPAARRERGASCCIMIHQDKSGRP